jgi:hypothetical protein
MNRLVLAFKILLIASPVLLLVAVAFKVLL